MSGISESAVPAGFGSKERDAGFGGEELASQPMQVDSGPTDSVPPVAFPAIPRDFVDPTFMERMRNFLVGQIAPPLHSLVIARSTESVASVFKKLIDFKVTSLPILDVTTNNYVAFIDMLDILAFLVEKMELQDKRNWNLVEDWMAQLQFQGSCLHVIQKSKRNPWYVIQASECVHRAMDIMAEFNIHRLAVSDMNNNFVSILTQSRLVTWLAEHIHEAGPLADMTLEDFKFGYREVLCVPDSCFAIEAFLKIHEAGVSGVAVVNDANEIVGSISASDLKDIGFEAGMFQKLFVPIRLFLESKQEGVTVPRVAYATRGSTVQQVLNLMRTIRIHRCFVTEGDSDMRLVGVITLNDVLELFSFNPS